MSTLKVGATLSISIKTTISRHIKVVEQSVEKKPIFDEDLRV